MPRISTILMVDDSPDNLYLLDLIMQGQNFKTLSASNGIEAVESVKQNKVDLILMDVMMPEMDGFEASRHIRNRQESAHIPIILITAKKREAEDVIRGLGEGAVEYLTKPFDDEELLARVKAMLRIKHLHDDNRELLAQVTAQKEQMKNELKMAEAVQRQFLPSKEFIAQFKECNIEAHYLAATSIGGDIYDFLRYGEKRVAFMIADVTGHGPAAALIMALAKGLMNTESADFPSPSTLAKRLNAKLLTMIPESHFITLFFGIADFNTRQLTYITAGHPSPYIVSDRLKEPITLKNTGTIIGIFDESEAKFGEDTIPFEKGDKLVFFSDGVFEARNAAGEMYGLKRLYEYVHSKRAGSAKEISDGIISTVQGYWDGKSELDDIAVVAVELL